MAQPVQELGESPLVGVNAAAPFNGFEILGVGERGDLLRLLVGAMVAPQVVLVEGLHVRVDGHHARSGRVEGDGFDLLAGNAGRGDCLAGGSGEGAHVVGVRLGGVVGIFALAVQRVFFHRGAQAAALAVHDGDANAQCSEVNSCNDGHA